jgi:hypothetical protein
MGFMRALGTDIAASREPSSPPPCGEAKTAQRFWVGARSSSEGPSFADRAYPRPKFALQISTSPQGGGDGQHPNAANTETSESSENSAAARMNAEEVLVTPLRTFRTFRKIRKVFPGRRTQGCAAAARLSAAIEGAAALRYAHAAPRPEIADVRRF